uniref:Cysteine proteinase inhibitor n=1 Tax=Oryza glumipatula TaxID=40148 RepID=A0A0D9Z2R2_9ORYZ
MAGCLWPCVTGGGAAADGAGSLFRSKARGPVEVVRHARELLAFLAENHDACGDKRDVKREHKAVANVNDKSIQQAGQFGLWIYRQITRLYFLRYVNVVSGQTQPYNGGYNYRLVVTVYGGPNWKTTLYDADVWGIPGTTTHWWFRSFTPKRS